MEESGVAVPGQSRLEDDWPCRSFRMTAFVLSLVISVVLGKFQFSQIFANGHQREMVPLTLQPKLRKLARHTSLSTGADVRIQTVRQCPGRVFYK